MSRLVHCQTEGGSLPLPQLISCPKFYVHAYVSHKYVQSAGNVLDNAGPIFTLNK